MQKILRVTVPTMLDGFHVCCILDPLIYYYFFLNYYLSLIEVLAQKVATLSWP